MALILPLRMALLALFLGQTVVGAQTFLVPRVEVGGHARMDWGHLRMLLRRADSLGRV